MNTKSSAYYQREFRRRLREQGLVKKEVWIRPENASQLAAFEKQLREPNDTLLQSGAQYMSNTSPTQTTIWTTETLKSALLNEDLFSSKQATIELIEGVEQSLHIVMHEFGDLPIFLTVSGDQIIAESLLWSASDVNNTAEFNEMILKTHKYFPLSTVCIDKAIDGNDYYFMFGALSASSIIQNIVLEIEALADNVIQATEAYSDFITISKQA